ncbi:toxin-antitoxin system HicB family antitoxin [Candidatus Thiosymbion oneisti]|uniref:toxin-antitoxin system HicB family antitoxin n=1 Tax=Candidatus Thiosymbion oneisti TaxID=589554 RepID=UPI0010608467|nr:toxin-antitoxin system HicB family antitoxin [Candidatus Thiosymbion oneisti]
MGALSLRLPESIHRHIREIAKQEGVSINQLISSAVSEKISALLTEEYIQARAKRADIGKVEQILANVPDRDPATEDLR